MNYSLFLLISNMQNQVDLILLFISSVKSLEENKSQSWMGLVICGVRNSPIKWLLEQINILLSKSHKQSRGWKDKVNGILIDIYSRPNRCTRPFWGSSFNDFFKHLPFKDTDLQAHHVNPVYLCLNLSLETFHLLLLQVTHSTMSHCSVYIYRSLLACTLTSTHTDHNV